MRQKSWRLDTSNNEVVKATAVIRATSVIVTGLAIATAIGVLVSSVAKAVEKKK